MLAAKLGVFRQHVGQSRRVREQVVDGDGAALAAAEVRQELRHRVGQRQLAPIAEPQHGRRGHRLGRRRDQERQIRLAPRRRRGTAPGPPGGRAAPPRPRRRCPSARASTGSPPRNGWRDRPSARRAGVPRPSRPSCRRRRWPRRGSGGASCERPRPRREQPCAPNLLRTDGASQGESARVASAGTSCGTCAPGACSAPCDW